MDKELGELIDDELGTVDFAEELRILRNIDPHIIDLLYTDHSGDPYGIPIAKLAALQLVFHNCKDAGYGRSWAKRGEVNAFSNTMRKADRLERLGVIVLSGNDTVVSMAHHVALVDTLLDQSNYDLMWVSFIAKVRPDVFEEWLRSTWCKATGIDYDDIEQFIGGE